MSTLSQVTSHLTARQMTLCFSFPVYAVQPSAKETLEPPMEPSTRGHPAELPRSSQSEKLEKQENAEDAKETLQGSCLRFAVVQPKYLAAFGSTMFNSYWYPVSLVVVGVLQC